MQAAQRPRPHRAAGLPVCFKLPPYPPHTTASDTAPRPRDDLTDPKERQAAEEAANKEAQKTAMARVTKESAQVGGWVGGTRWVAGGWVGGSAPPWPAETKETAQALVILHTVHAPHTCF